MLGVLYAECRCVERHSCWVSKRRYSECSLCSMSFRLSVVKLIAAASVWFPEMRDNWATTDCFYWLRKFNDSVSISRIWCQHSKFYPDCQNQYCYDVRHRQNCQNHIIRNDILSKTYFVNLICASKQFSLIHHT